MADNSNKLIGQNYTTPDIVAKVTGKAKYAEDYRVDGMLWTKLLLSPMPHARIARIDLSAALAMPGVKAIVTADDLPEAQGGGTLGEGVQASTQGERILTKEPVYEGEPVLAVAAVDEITAAEAIEKIGPLQVGANLYITSLDIDPSGRYIYYIPGAHGGAVGDGTPIVQYDLRTGKRKVLAFLHQHFWDKVGYALDGSFGNALDEKIGRAHV